MILSFKYKLLFFFILLYSGKYVKNLIPHQSKASDEIRVYSLNLSDHYRDFSYPKSVSENETILISGFSFLGAGPEIMIDKRPGSSLIRQKVYRVKYREGSKPCIEVYKLDNPVREIENGLCLIRQIESDGRVTFRKYVTFF